MTDLYRSSQRGQVLILVALAIFVLVGAVALAVDGGNLYAERRKMQNAADAGALAGANDICFNNGTPTTAQQAANLYASYNGAESSDATVDDLTVTVVVTEVVPTFFAGAIGFREVPVTARAAARCSGAVAAGGIWPLALRDHVYRDELECGEYFYAFVAKVKGNPKDDEEDSYDEVSPIDCNICECALKLTGGDTAQYIAPGERGWLRLFQPPDPYSDPCPKHNCGAEELRCWLEYAHPGPVRIGDCLPGKPGVTSSGEKVVDDLGEEIVEGLDRPGAVRNLVLYDGEVCTDTLGHCSGTGYHVSGFGCVQIIEWTTADFLRKDGTNPACAKNMSVVIARKLCGPICESETGVGGGESPPPEEVRSVSLVE